MTAHERHRMAAAHAIQEAEALRTMVAYAHNVADELMQRLGSANDKAAYLLGAVYQAVGEDTSTQESARNALEHAAVSRDRILEALGMAVAVRDHLLECVGLVHVSAEELRRYLGGF